MVTKVREWLTNEDSRPLHRIPFLILWIASYAVAVAIYIIIAIVFSELVSYEVSNWMSQNIPSLLAASIGTLLAVIASLIQIWLIRRRYGFVPKYWRIASILGVTIMSTILFTKPDIWNANNFLLMLVIAAVGLNIAQALTLHPVNKRAWLMTIVPLFAGVIASRLESPNSWYNDTTTEVLLCFVVVYAIGTGIVVIHLMTNPREGSVPKRNDEKTKPSTINGLHPATFMGFWMITHLMAWLILYIGWITTFDSSRLFHVLNRWLHLNNLDSLIGMMWGVILGLITAIGQSWLMK